MVSSFTPGFDANAIFLKLEKQAEKWSQQQAEYESLDVHTTPLLHTLMLIIVIKRTLTVSLLHINVRTMQKQLIKIR